MKALVTGGAGFLGGHVVDVLLAKGYSVVVLARSFDKAASAIVESDEVERIEADVRDFEAVSVAARGCDWIFHCAALVGADTYAQRPVETMETEVLALQSVCNAALRNDVSKVIYPSSSAVYGDAGNAGILDESVAVAPTSSYAVAKRFNELFLDAQHRENGLSSVSLRIFNIYGPRQDERLVVPRFFKQAIGGQPLRIFGSGAQTRDFTYIEDVADAAVRCAESVEGCEILNVASGRECTVRALAEEIITTTGSSSTISFIDAPVERSNLEVARCVGSSIRLQRLTGYAPSTTLSEGLSRTLAWMKR